LKISIIKELL